MKMLKFQKNKNKLPRTLPGYRTLMASQGDAHNIDHCLS